MDKLTKLKSFIEGFEGDEQQDGISELVATIKEIELALVSINAMAGNLHVLKDLRAWATAENKETKAAILRITESLISA